MSLPQTNTERPLVGILFVALAAFAFALSDSTVKHLTSGYPVPVIAAVRYIVSLVVVGAVLGPRLGSQLWRTERTWLVLARGFCLSLATLTMGWALSRMPVGEAVAILYLSPFAVMLLAVPILGEKVGPFTWIGATIGFLGVLLIVRPGSGLDPLGVFFALLNACIAVAYTLLSRGLSKTESTSALMFYVIVVGAVFFIALAIPELPQLEPKAADLGLMAVVGLLATGGHFLLTAAYRFATASILAPITYMHLVWAAGLGYVFFAHIPDTLTLSGMALILTSGIAIAVRAHVVRRRERPGSRIIPQ